MEKLAKKLEEIGFEPGESLDAIDSVTLGFEKPGGEPLGVFRKKSAWNLDALKKQENLKEDNHEGKTYYHMRRDAVYFPDGKTLIIGREQLVKDAITRGPKSGAAEKFSFLPKGHVVIGFLPENTDKFKNELKPNMMVKALLGKNEYFTKITEALQGIKGGGVAIHFGSGMEFKVLARCANSADAGKLSGGIQEGLADAHKWLNENRDKINKAPPAEKEGMEIAEMVFDTISAGESGDSATLSMEVSSAAIDRMELLAKQNQGGKAMPPMMPPMMPGFDFGKMFGNFGGGLGGDAAQRSRDKNNLKQIGLAMHNYHDTYRSFPPAKDNRNPQRGSQLSWRVHILPFIDQAPLYQQFRLDEPWSSPHNRRLISQMPDIYRKPGSNPAPGKTNYVGISGPGGLMENGGGKQLRDISDGTSNTIMVTEVEDHAAVTWTQPVDYQYNPGNPIGSLGGWNGGFHVLLCDGTVRFIAKNINPRHTAELVPIQRWQPPWFFLRISEPQDGG